MMSCGIISLVKKRIHEKKQKEAQKMKVVATLAQEEMIKLEEIKLAYLRQGKKAKISEIVGEALNDLWQKMYKK